MKLLDLIPLSETIRVQHPIFAPAYRLKMYLKPNGKMYRVDEQLNFFFFRNVEVTTDLTLDSHYYFDDKWEQVK